VSSRRKADETDAWVIDIVKQLSIKHEMSRYNAYIIIKSHLTASIPIQPIEIHK